MFCGLAALGWLHAWRTALENQFWWQFLNLPRSRLKSRRARHFSALELPVNGGSFRVLSYRIRVDSVYRDSYHSPHTVVKVRAPYPISGKPCSRPINMLLAYQ